MKSYDFKGWPGKIKGQPAVNKGSATNPTTLILSGTILSLNSSSSYGHAVREGLTGALVRSISDVIGVPTLITLASFDAVPGNRSVTLKWVTESEVDNAGFNLYRSEAADGEYVKINGVLIPAEGSSTQGVVYQFTDVGMTNGEKYYYLLEDIDTKGKAEKHGPQSATPRLIYGPLSRR